MSNQEKHEHTHGVLKAIKHWTLMGGRARHALPIVDAQTAEHERDVSTRLAAARARGDAAAVAELEQEQACVVKLATHKRALVRAQLAESEAKEKESEARRVAHLARVEQWQRELDALAKVKS